MHDLLIADLKRVYGSSDVLELMCADVEARRQLGITRYGRALQAHNGRDARQDGYDELQDFLVYALQALHEAPPGSAGAELASWAYDTVLDVAVAWKKGMLQTEAENL
jgi:hypothetical protein